MFNSGDFQVLDEINSKGMIYAGDYSANYTDRSIPDKAYVDGQVGSGSIYDQNGTLTGNRTLTGEGDSLTLDHYNGTSSSYTLRSRILMEDADITFSSALGDGFGADIAPLQYLDA